jgi:aromatic ring-opening dioxygenase LigB subunit
VPFDAPVGACVALGGDLARRGRRVAMLAMGDGSARRSTKAPGYLDPRAQRYDADVAASLASADAGGLARLDPALSAELMAAGRAAWQVLAGAAGGGQFRGQLRRLAAPYGVAYLVASWKPNQDVA